MPKLRVLAGPSPHDLTPITSLVNTNAPHRIVTDAWEGEIIVFIKGFNQPDASGDGVAQEVEYFQRGDRSGVTWSIQVQGRFLSPRSANDVLFGNIFERPLKLPWGTGAALKFMKFIDPTLSHDLTCTATQKPWALSPLVATMPYLRHARLADADAAFPQFPPPTSISDYTAMLNLCAAPGSSDGRASTPSSSGSSTSGSSRFSGSSRRSTDSKKNKPRNSDGTMTSQQRRAYFASEAHRNSVVLGPQDIITTDFCYGFLEFAPALRLRLPGGVGFDLARYWDGQPVRFVCCERKRETDPPADDEDPWGRVFWCVSIEVDGD